MPLRLRHLAPLLRVGRHAAPLPPRHRHPAAYREALAQAQQLRTVGRGGAFGVWEEAGPTNVGGRISDIEFAPSAPDVVYASAATGGVFRSDDAGFTWSPIFDD